jgi:hypothetical protein
MTNFAILTFVDDASLISAEHAFNLSIITYVGCSLSILGLALTFITYFLFPVRQSCVQFILFSFS